MRSAGLLLAGVALAAFVAAAAGAALVTFAAQLLPQGAAGQLGQLPGTWLGVIGLVDAPTAAGDSAAISAQARGDLGRVPFTQYTMTWSAPLKLTPPSGSAVGGAEVAAAPQIAAHATLTAGTWPASPIGTGAPVPVAVPVTVARQLGVRVGDVLRVTNSNTGARLRIRVSGVYQQDNPAAAYWNLDAIWTCNARAQGCFTQGGPVVANPAAFIVTPALSVDQASWLVVPDAARIPTSALTETAARVSASTSTLQGSPGLIVSGSLAQNLAAVAAELSASRTGLVIIGLLLLLPAAGALILAARLLAAYREEEHALLLARGATRASLVGPVLAEAVLTGGVAAIAGVLAGPWIARLLVTGSGGVAPGAVSLVPADVWPALAVVLLCAVILTWPVLSARRPGAGRARRAALAGAAVAGGDVALLALAALGGWQLAGYSPAAGAGINPVVVAAPALVLAAVSLVPLRVQPILARLLDRAAAAAAGVTGAMAAWEISRQAVRRSAPVLLTVLAVATAALAVASYASWTASARDQAAFTAGADVRVDAPLPLTAAELSAVRHAPGVTAAMTSATSPLGTGALLALDAVAAPDTVLLRSDLSPVPESALFGLLTTGSRPVPAIATTAFLRASGLATGETYPATIGDVTIPIRIVAAVSAFPQLPADSGGGLVADRSAVNRVLAADHQSSLPATSVWLRDSDGAAASGLPVPAGSIVTSQASVAAGLLDDPLARIPQRAALGVAVAVTLLAALGFAAASAATLRDRRGRRVLLKALGVPLPAQTGQLCGEELLLAIPAAGAGLLAGIALSHLLISVLVLTPAGAAPVPPVAVIVPLGWAVAAAAAICAIPPLLAFTAGDRRQNPAAALREAEAA